MKRMLFAAVMIFAAFSSRAQNEVSLYAKFDSIMNPILIPWLVHSDEVFLEMRYNFDNFTGKKLYAVFLGVPIKNSSTAITPAIGTVFGYDYRSVSPEIYFVSASRRYMLFSMVQYSAAFGGTDFLYCNSKLFFLSGQFSLGAVCQIFCAFTENPRAYIDVGPEVRVSFGPRYVKLLGLWNPRDNARKLFLVAGINF